MIRSYTNEEVAELLAQVPPVRRACWAVGRSIGSMVHLEMGEPLYDKDCPSVDIGTVRIELNGDDWMMRKGEQRFMQSDDVGDDDLENLTDKFTGLMLESFAFVPDTNVLHIVFSGDVDIVVTATPADREQADQSDSDLGVLVLPDGTIIYCHPTQGLRSDGSVSKLHVDHASSSRLA